MKELLEIKKVVLLVIVLTFCLGGCRSNFYLSKREDKILDKYGEIANLKDTVIHNNKYQLTYKEGVLLSIGKLHDDTKNGVWWYFSKNHVVKYVVDYRKNSIDTLCAPTVNKSDW